MREHDAVEGDRAEALGTLEVALLRGGEQRVQHLDRRLEHLDEFQQALVGQAQAAAVAVGVGVVLGVGLELADVDLAHQRADVLVVLVARLGLGDAHLLEDAGVALDDAELADVAAELLQPLHRPGAEDACQVAPGNAVLGFQDRPVLTDVEQTQRRLVHRRALDRVEGHVLHQLLQPLGDRALAPAHRAQQVEDLLLFLQPLRGVAEVRDDLLDRLFHAVELGEGRVDLDDLVREDARQPRVVARVDGLRLADRLEHALGSGGIGQRVALAFGEVVLEGHLLLAAAFVAGGEAADHVHADLLVRQDVEQHHSPRHLGRSDDVQALPARAPSELSGVSSVSCRHRAQRHPKS